MQNITELLQKWETGDQMASDELFSLVYQDLQRIARRRLRGESPLLTLQTTDLINESYFRLAAQKNVRWANRSHFYGIAAESMRRVLIDHIKAKLRDKRGGQLQKIALEDVSSNEILIIDKPHELVALDNALDLLATVDSFQAEVVKQKFFGGFKIEEIAVNLDKSVATVNRAWKVAKLWLNREISRQMQLSSDR
jgi:RNA polymerase sigma factor (TIGR02999 family)